MAGKTYEKGEDGGRGGAGAALHRACGQRSGGSEARVRWQGELCSYDEYVAHGEEVGGGARFARVPASGAARAMAAGRGGRGRVGAVGGVSGCGRLRAQARPFTPLPHRPQGSRLRAGAQCFVPAGRLRAQAACFAPGVVLQPPAGQPARRPGGGARCASRSGTPGGGRGGEGGGGEARGGDAPAYRGWRERGRGTGEADLGNVPDGQWQDEGRHSQAGHGRRQAEWRKPAPQSADGHVATVAATGAPVRPVLSAA